MCFGVCLRCACVCACVLVPAAVLAVGGAVCAGPTAVPGPAL
jgi:hypothetical protein